MLARAHTNAHGLRSEFAPFLPLARLFGWLPVYGPDLAVAPDLLEAADGLTLASVETYLAPSPALNRSDAPGSLLEGIVSQLVVEEERLANAGRPLNGRAAHGSGWAWPRSRPV